MAIDWKKDCYGQPDSFKCTISSKTGNTIPKGNQISSYVYVYLEPDWCGVAYLFKEMLFLTIICI